MRLDVGAGVLHGYMFWLETRYHTRKGLIAPVTAQNYYSQAKQWVTWCDEHEKVGRERRAMQSMQTLGIATLMLEAG